MDHPLRLKFSQPQAIALFLALTALGLVGNYLRFELFFSIEFLFGSIFTMLAVQTLGLRWGAVTGLVVSSITWPLWNHPWAFVIMTCEVVVVGLLFRRRNLDLVLADALFWLFLGMPLVYLFHMSVMHLSIENVTLTALKQAINGINNTLVARLLFIAASRRFGTSYYSLREMIFNFLIFFLLAPSLLLLAFQGRADIVETEQAVRNSISFAGQRIAGSLGNWLDAQRSHLSFLATTAATASIPSMQQHLEDSLPSQGILRLGVMNRSAVSIAYAPAVDQLGNSTIGLDFSDRPYLADLKKNLHPLLTETMMGRVGTPLPIAAMVVPILKNGVFNGFIGGVLNLSQLKHILQLHVRDHMLPGVTYTLTDRNNRIIISNQVNTSIMEPFTREKGELVPLKGGIAEWLPESRKNISVSDRWSNGFFVAEHKVGPLSEWTIILEQPIAPFQNRLYARYAMHLGRLSIILFAALTLAHLLSRQAASSLVALSGISRDLPDKVAANQHLQWPESAVIETGSLIENFKAMARILTEQFHDIQTMNTTLEQQFEERTAELLESREQYRLLAENTSDVVWRIDLTTMRFVYISPAVFRMTGFTPEEVLAIPVEATFTPQSLREVQHWITDAIQDFANGRTETRDLNRQVELWCKDGSTLWVEVGSSFILNEHNQPVAITGISRDIRKRKLIEDKLKESEARFRSLFENVLVVSLLIDPIDGTIVDANAAAERFYGWSSATLRTMRINDINAAATDTIKSELEKARKKERNYFLFRHRLADSTERDVEVYAGPIRSEGRVILYSIVHDITDRLQAEKALREKTEALKDLTQQLEIKVKSEIAARLKNEQILIQQAKLAAMGEMIGAIAHQWRQPLNTLGLCVQNVRDAWRHQDLDDEYLETTTESALVQIRHMSRTIDDFRNFFLPDKTKTIFDTMAAAGEVLSLFSAQLRANNITYELYCRTHDKWLDTLSDIEPCPEKTIAGYRNEFEHVLLNLINNAKDSILAKEKSGRFSQGESGRIFFEFAKEDQTVTIKVCDNGGGIPPSIIDRIFEPYFTTKTPGQSGTGIGLYMAKTIIEDHMQGRLTAENSTEGAVFTITLPATDEVTANEEAPDESNTSEAIGAE